MIQIKRLDHIQICIPVGKEFEAREFYANIMGLTEIQKPEALKNNGALWFQAGDIQLHIGPENGNNKSKRHPAFEVQDITSARLHLEKHGVSINEKIEVPGRVRFSFFDPFENKIELLQLIH